MNCRTQYNTKQHDEVLEYLKSVRGQHVTAAEVYEDLARKAEYESLSRKAEPEGLPKKNEDPADRQEKPEAVSRKIGKATVYRQLERLVEEGFADKYIIDQNTPACFEYIDHNECGEGICVHGKCLKCGRLFHLHCDELLELREHLEEHHGFTPDFHHTVIYGLCEDCAKRDNE